MKRGVLLLNFGGPWTLEEVSPFLYRLFADPSILVGIPAPFRQIVAFLVSRIKGASSRRAYALIGGGSPQLRWTREQAHGLAGILAKEGNGAEFRVELGMRASEPGIARGLAGLREWGAEEVVLFPLFPQFSTTTTGSCLKEAHRLLQQLDWHPSIREITHWPDDAGYVALLRATLDESIKKAEEDRGPASDPIHVLFSAHSLPLRIVRRGDPYPGDVARTVAGAVRGLKLPWSVAFQSRNGPMPWLEPRVENEIARLGAAGVRRLIVTPVSFVSDHIETTYELDQLYSDHARRCGIGHYYRVRSFNGDPAFHSVLRGILARNGV